MKVCDAIAGAAERLTAVSDTPRLDAELLMAAALGVERDAMLLGDRDVAAPATFEALIERRLAHEPVAYIIGHRDFWTIRLAVGPGVLIPRPDSETLIEAAVAHFGPGGPRSILDLGTGPGTLLLAALNQWPDAKGVGVDASPVALEHAVCNAAALGLAARATFKQGDWATGLDERFDLVLCNPPYVEDAAALSPQVSEWEPAEALYAGRDGLADYRRLAPELPRLIAPGGIMCLEIGAGQAEAVTTLMTAAGLAAAARKDLGGHVRCLILSLPR